ncbi:MAG TPA: non-canonical purine NTP pyrophosphatase, partial [Candidatus Saccharimonadales bacterium]|nr:non-canonical purine NTP pyrophosphatase [Candidatus Saccharimonadales bacterium]
GIMPDIEGYDIDLPEVQETDAHVIIREKLLEGLKHKDAELIVEDTSLYFEALNGLPGPLIKWFLKTVGNDGLYNIALKLGNNKAQAKTIIGYAKNADEIEYFEGTIEGEIVEPAGDKDFGWGPIFKPLGHERTFGEMEREEKNSLSMRKMAFEKLKEHLSGEVK